MKFTGKDLENILQSRLFIYELLLNLVGKPVNHELLLGLQQEPSFKSLTEISQGATDIHAFINTFNTMTAKQRDIVLEETRQEYNRLFVGPNALPAPLWESVYLSPEHIMFEEITLRVREVYQSYGLSFERKLNEPDDHIMLELEFMKILIQRTISLSMDFETEERERLIEGQLMFLQEHLLKWAPQSFEILYQSTSSKLYQGVALLLTEFLPCDLEIVKSVKGGFAE